MRLAGRHWPIPVAEHLLDLAQGAPLLDQKRRLLVAQIVDPQMRQADLNYEGDRDFLCRYLVSGTPLTESIGKFTNNNDEWIANGGSHRGQ